MHWFHTTAPQISHRIWPEMTVASHLMSSEMSHGHGHCCQGLFKLAASSWWRHQIFRVTGPLCGQFPTKRPVTRSFDVFFDLRLIKRLSKPRDWWFDMLSRPLWRHCHGYWITFQETLSFLQVSFLTTKVVLYNCQADSRLAPSQWVTSLQSNAVPHWLVANLESALNWYRCGMWRFILNSWSPTQHGGGHGHLLLGPVTPIWTTHCIYLSWVVISNRKETNCLPLADDVARIRSRVQEPCLE